MNVLKYKCMEFCDLSIIRFLPRIGLKKKIRNWQMLNTSLLLVMLAPPSRLPSPGTLQTWIYFLFESQSHWLLDILPAVTISKLLNSWPSFVLKWCSYEAQWYIICREYRMLSRSLRTREWFLFSTFSKTSVQLVARTWLESVTGDACSSDIWRSLYALHSGWEKHVTLLGCVKK